MAADDWVYAGSSRILSQDNRTTVPAAVLEEGGFDSDSELVWAYERESGAVLATIDVIADDRIVSVDRRTVLEENDRNVVWIPFPLIDDAEDTARSDHPEPVPDGVRFDPNDRLHWVCDPSAYDWDTEWWYVLTDEELGNGLDSGNRSARPP